MHHRISDVVTGQRLQPETAWFIRATKGEQHCIVYTGRLDENCVPTDEIPTMTVDVYMDEVRNTPVPETEYFIGVNPDKRLIMGPNQVPKTREQFIADTGCTEDIASFATIAEARAAKLILSKRRP